MAKDLFNPYAAEIDFNDSYLTEQLITYIGNKRNLLGFINSGVEKVKEKLGKRKITALDGFAGSGVVSRLLKYHADILHSNDLERYSYVVNRCYLSNRSEVDLSCIKAKTDELNAEAKNRLISGFITENYAPRRDDDIQPHERAFYTHENAQILDTLKHLIFSTVPEENNFYFLAPLIVKASVHTNTSGVFKGFHKKDGIGHFGGSGENALQRILKRIELPYPVFGLNECEVKVFQEDTNTLVAHSDFEYDLAYYDPPYNQHPYGSNYFMLNILATPAETVPIQKGVSGIAEHWNRSAWNKKLPAVAALDALVKTTPAKYVLISYNNEGIIPFETFKSIVSKYGTAELLEHEYNTYRGCRNLSGRNIKVKELLWLIKK